MAEEKSRFANLEVAPDKATDTTVLYEGDDQKPIVEGKVTHKDGKTYNGLNLESGNGFDHISVTWQDQCIPFGEAYDLVHKDELFKQDIKRTKDNFRFGWDNGPVVAFDHPNGEDVYNFTEKGFPRVARSLGIPALAVKFLMENGYAEDMVRYCNDMSGKLINDKVFRLFDGQVRAMVSDQYQKLDDGMMWELLAASIPSDALVSHWSPDLDGTSRFNLFLPDRMRNLDWTNVGIGCACKNSEVTESSCGIAPYIFSDVCLNGTIWNRRDSSLAFDQRHSGNFTYHELVTSTKAIIKAALGFAEGMVDALDAVRGIKIKDPKKTILAIGKAMGVSPQKLKDWYRNYQIEEDYCGQSAGSVINALTRACQTYDNRCDYEEMAGNLLMPSMEYDLRKIMASWESWESQANRIEDAETEKVFAYVSF